MDVATLIEKLSEYVGTLPCEVVLEEIGIDVRIEQEKPKGFGMPLSGDEYDDFAGRNT